MKPTCITLFAGGGLKTLGAMAAGFEPIMAVEWNPDRKLGAADAIAQVYAQNVSPHILAQPVQDVDYTSYKGVDLLMASPVCKSFSIANPNGVEGDAETESALGVCRAIKETGPRWVVIENVWAYRQSKSFAHICDELTRMGYMYDYARLNSADFGVPQTRHRLILRAVQGGLVPSLPSPVPWVGWYEAIEDLIPTLPPNRFADWQLKRLPRDLNESVVVKSGNSNSEGPIMKNARKPAFTVTTMGCSARAFLVEGDAAGERCPTLRNAHEPAYTVKAAVGGRAGRAFLISRQAGDYGIIRDQSSPAFAATTHEAHQYRAFLANVQSYGGIGTCGQSPCFSLTANHGAGEYRAWPVGVQGEGGDLTRSNYEPSQTITANHDANKYRAWLETGRVVAMTPRCLARFQSMPDSYILPERKSLAATIIGNGVPCVMAQRICEAFLQGE